jgi:hypothetical protein
MTDEKSKNKYRSFPFVPQGQEIPFGNDRKKSKDKNKSKNKSKKQEQKQTQTLSDWVRACGGRAGAGVRGRGRFWNG